MHLDEYQNFLKDKKDSESNKRITTHNSYYAECAKYVHDCVSFGGSVEQVEEYLKRIFHGFNKKED